MAPERQRRFPQTDPWLSRSEARPAGSRPWDYLAPGVLLGDVYRISSILGAGGMGVVYVAERVDDGARVAIKVLQTDRRTALDAVARFHAEARVTAALCHPNLVEATDSGATPDGRPFLVMPLLEGRSLAALLAEQGTLSESETARILDQVLDGLAAAHDQGIVHRDLKPENVFLSREDRDRQVVRILDFGVAMFLSSPPSSDEPPLPRPADDPQPPVAPQRLTRGGMVMGTPGYMAPEVAANAAEVDQRADLFSVAVLAFEMLTGRLPFVGGTVLDILTATVENPVPRPGALRPGLSAAMERLVVTGLAKRPADRFQTAAEFRLRLAHAIAGRFPRGARPCVTETSDPQATLAGRDDRVPGLSDG